MRFISFDKNAVETVGVRLGDEVVDLSIAAPQLPGTLLGIIQADMLAEAGDAAKRAGSSARVPLDGIKYLPVIPHPRKVLGLGKNYGSHVGARPKEPGFFVSTASRLCAHGEPMVVPRLSRTLDYEVELALVMRKGGKHIPARDALNYVAGYTVFNDGSVRGHGRGTALAPTKNSDKTAPFGPELVTPDELPPGCAGLRLSLRRNGQEVQNDTTDNMFWKIRDVIEELSRRLTLSPGDVITTGTCGGTVMDMHRDRDPEDESLPYLREGEVVECDVEGIGVLRNPIVEER